MFRQWLHGAAIAAGYFTGVPYWQTGEQERQARQRPDAVPHPSEVKSEKSLSFPNGLAAAE